MISPATPHRLLYPPPQMEHYCTYIFSVLHGRVEVAKSKMAAVIWRNRRRALLGETSKAQEQTILRLIFLKRSRQMRKLPEGNGKKRNVLSSYAANSCLKASSHPAQCDLNSLFAGDHLRWEIWRASAQCSTGETQKQADDHLESFH